MAKAPPWQNPRERRAYLSAAIATFLVLFVPAIALWSSTPWARTIGFVAAIAGILAGEISMRIVRRNDA